MQAQASFACGLPLPAQNTRCAMPAAVTRVHRRTFSNEPRQTKIGHLGAEAFALRAVRDQQDIVGSEVSMQHVLHRCRSEPKLFSACPGEGMVSDSLLGIQTCNAPCIRLLTTTPFGGQTSKLMLSLHPDRNQAKLLPDHAGTPWRWQPRALY